MNITNQVKELKQEVKSWAFKLQNLDKEQFNCPVCNYTGAFIDFYPETGIRRHAQCPRCRALERHRIQYLVVDRLLADIDTANLSMMHFAPENFFRNYFAQKFGNYETADLYMEEVDHKVDLQALPFDDASYDFVFASHVLEHIADDHQAIAEIRRILKPKGIAVLPVPIVAETTVEYPEPNPHEEYHVRAPGLDYGDRYEAYFSKVDQISSDILPAKHQLYVYENRSNWSKDKYPLRPSMTGEKFIDIVPVCYV